jgi:hypothetical protein
MNSEAYNEGYEGYIAGLNYDDNPYDNECHPFAAPSKEWCDWYRGWDDAYLQFGRSG